MPRYVHLIPGPELSPEGKGNPGDVISVDKKSFTIACGEGALKILSLQPEGKKKMDTASFLLGNKIENGTKLG